MCGVVAYFSFVLITQQFRLQDMDREQEMAQMRLEAAQQENAELLKEKDNLSSEDYIEKIAREELGMTRQGELPYRTGRQ